MSFQTRLRGDLSLILAAPGPETMLAALAMIASAHGRATTLNELRLKFPISANGLNSQAVHRLAEQLGLAARAVEAQGADLMKLALPALVQLPTGGFAVLGRVGPRRCVFYDPVRGVRSALTRELDAATIYEITRTNDFKAVRAEGGFKLKHLWTRSRGLVTSFAQVLALSVALQVFALALPFQMQLVIDEGVMAGDRNLLLVVALAFGLIVVVQQATEACRSWILQIVGQSLHFQVTGNIVRHLMRLPADFFERRHLGDILSRLGSAKSIQELLTKGMVSAIIDGVMAVVTIMVLAVYSWKLTAVILVSVALLAALNLISFPLLRRRSEEEMADRANEQTSLMEIVRASTTIKLMGREAEREAVWRNHLASALNAGSDVAWLNIMVAAARGAIMGLQSVVVIYLGAKMVVDGEGMSVGMLVAFLSFRTTFTERMMALITQFQQFRFVGLHLDRLADIVQIKPEPIDVPAIEVSGRISLSGVAFRYGEDERLVLKGADLEVAPGEFLAITGPSGGGKTTLLKLILGFRAPTSGAILLDGRPATLEVSRGWRESVGLVAQDDRLLSGTIAENIAFFDPAMDVARVREAAMAAQIHNDVMAMPAQYASLIGDMGSALSGGQRQRVLLARALYRRPKVLILDEGTANLDLNTERQIAQVLRDLPITRIVVAHRPALIELADRVVVVVDGAVAPAAGLAPMIGPGDRQSGAAMGVAQRSK